MYGFSNSLSLYGYHVFVIAGFALLISAVIRSSKTSRFFFFMSFFYSITTCTFLFLGIEYAIPAINQSFTAKTIIDNPQLNINSVKIALNKDPVHKLGLTLKTELGCYAFGKTSPLNADVYYIQNIYMGDIPISNQNVSLYAEFGAIEGNIVHLYNATKFFRNDMGLILTENNIPHTQLPLPFSMEVLYEFSYPSDKKIQIMPILKNRLFYNEFTSYINKSFLYYLSGLIFLWIVGALSFAVRDSVRPPLTISKVLSIALCYPVGNFIFSFILLVMSIIHKLLFL